MNDTPLLLAHSRVEVYEALTRLLAPREVRVVNDMFGAGAEVTSGSFGVIILEHPLLGMEAPYMSSWLRDMGATCPVLVLADGLADTLRKALDHPAPPG